MISNEKPRTLGTGQITNDGESITHNVTATHRLIPNQEMIVGKSSPIVTDSNIINSSSRDEMLEIGKMLREQRERRDDAALRLPPMRCGCSDPLRCRCNSRGGGAS